MDISVLCTDIIDNEQEGKKCQNIADETEATVPIAMRILIGKNLIVAHHRILQEVQRVKSL